MMLESEMAQCGAVGGVRKKIAHTFVLLIWTDRFLHYSEYPGCSINPANFPLAG
jgi:hypothetical protein